MLDNAAIEKTRKWYLEEWYLKDNLKSLDVEKVTSSTLDELLSTCNKTKHIEERWELYDDEVDPERNTWIDVEGEGYGWAWLSKKDKPRKWHGIIKELLMHYIEQKKQNLSQSEEYVIRINTDVKMIYHFIERESEMRDIVYTFSNDEIDY